MPSPSRRAASCRNAERKRTEFRNGHRAKIHDHFTTTIWPKPILRRQRQPTLSPLRGKDFPSWPTLLNYARTHQRVGVRFPRAHQCDVSGHRFTPVSGRGSRLSFRWEGVVS
jgi:hypothetical protein